MALIVTVSCHCLSLTLHNFILVLYYLFKHPKHMLKLMDKKIITILRSKMLFFFKLYFLLFAGCVNRSWVLPRN